MVKAYLLSFLWPQLIASIPSLINGMIRVELSAGRYQTTVNRYWQSGPYAQENLLTALGHLHKDSKDVKKILLLGLGAGSMAHVLRNYFPSALIWGVEIDKNMIEVGIHYFKLNKIQKLSIHISDAAIFLKENKREKFDMIVSDIFVGCDSPPSIRTLMFAQNIKAMLTKKGVYVCNFSQNKEHKKETDAVVGHIQEVFAKTEMINKYPNLLVLAYTQ